MTTDEAIKYLDEMRPRVVHMNNDIIMLRGDALRMAISALEHQKWIPCSERMPKCEKEVYIITERGTCTTAIYEDGTMSTEDSAWNWNDMDFSYDEENDTYIIPELWLEYRHFNPDEVYNNIVDEKVIAWMPLPWMPLSDPYREEQN